MNSLRRRREEKSILAGFNADGTAGSIRRACDRVCREQLLQLFRHRDFQNVLATTQNDDTILYAVGFGQPKSYGAYILAEYDSAGNLLHSATDPRQRRPAPRVPLMRSSSTAAIWAVGSTQHSGDATNIATVWTANYNLSSVVTHKDSRPIVGLSPAPR